MVVLPKDLQSREALRLKIVDAFKNDFPEVRGRVKLLPNGPPVPYPVQFRVAGPGHRHRARAAPTRSRTSCAPTRIRSASTTTGTSRSRCCASTSTRTSCARSASPRRRVMRAANTILSGTPVGQFREDNKLIDIVVRQPVEERATHLGR